MNKPSVRAVEEALDVLLWLHENTENGSDRDDIGRVRYLLDEVYDPWEQREARRDS